IIPYKKGSNKVFVKKGQKYLSGKEGNSVQYTDYIGEDELFELVQIENSSENRPQFKLKNRNGSYLGGNLIAQQFSTDESFSYEIKLPAKTNNEINNWLISWYPGKEHDKERYEGVEFRSNDESDTSIKTAYDSTGKLITDSWVNQDDFYYYANSSGVLIKGWQEIRGNRYYFNPDSNSLVTGSATGTEIGNKLYNINESGALQRSAWDNRSGNWRYSDENGAYIEEGLEQIGGDIYYFKQHNMQNEKLYLQDEVLFIYFSEKGNITHATHLGGSPLDSSIQVTINGKCLMFSSDGFVRREGVFQKEEGGIGYYSLKDGSTYSGWKKIDGKLYYFTNGTHNTLNDHETIDGKTYYFNDRGEAQLIGFVNADGKLYYYDDQGIMQVGWKKIDDKWYYFDDTGAAKVGWFQVYGYFFPYYGYFDYYAKSDGSIYTNTEVELYNGRDAVNTYRFNSNGHPKKIR
ncbi:cell wall-binding protein, partial [Bacillus cereus]